MDTEKTNERGTRKSAAGSSWRQERQGGRLQRFECDAQGIGFKRDATGIDTSECGARCEQAAEFNDVAGAREAFRKDAYLPDARLLSGKPEQGPEQPGRGQDRNQRSWPNLDSSGQGCV